MNDLERRKWGSQAGSAHPFIFSFLHSLLSSLKSRSMQSLGEGASQWNVFLDHEEQLSMENLISFKIASEDSRNYIFQEETVW